MDIYVEADQNKRNRGSDLIGPFKLAVVLPGYHHNSLLQHRSINSWDERKVHGNFVRFVPQARARDGGACYVPHCVPCSTYITYVILYTAGV